MTDDCDAYCPAEEAEFWAARDAEERQALELRPQCPQCRSTWLNYHARPGPRGAVIRWTVCFDCNEMFDVEIDR